MEVLAIELSLGYDVNRVMTYIPAYIGIRMQFIAGTYVRNMRTATLRAQLMTEK